MFCLDLVIFTTNVSQRNRRFWSSLHLISLYRCLASLMSQATICSKLKNNLLASAFASLVKCKDEEPVWVEDSLSLRRGTMMATKKPKKGKKKKIANKRFNEVRCSSLRLFFFFSLPASVCAPSLMEGCLTLIYLL